MSGQLEVLDAGLPAGSRGWFTTRSGGVSAPPWAELNLALHVGDEPRRALANRDLLARHVGGGWVNFPQQVHGAAVAVVDASAAGRRRITHGGAAGVDALVSAERMVPLGVLVADCLPVLFAAPRAGVVAAAHAGRAGLAAGVLQATVAAMAELDAAPGDITAVIGPGVCGQCYEVPAALRDEVAATLPGAAATSRTGTPSLDLGAGATRLLEQLGLGQIRRTEICTVEDDRFFSYRRDHVTGRFAGVVMLDGDG